MFRIKMDIVIISSNGMVLLKIYSMRIKINCKYFGKIKYFLVENMFDTLITDNIYMLIH